MTYGDGVPPANGPGGYPAQTPPPADVAQAAQGFGAFVDVRELARARNRFFVWLIVAAACLGLLILVGNQQPSVFAWWYWIWRVVGLAFCFGMVFAIVTAIRTLAVGNRSYYVYADGFVYRHNGKVRAWPWTQVTGLQAQIAKRGDAAGKLSHYDLQVPGESVSIPVNIVDGRDTFLDHLIAAVSRHGKPIT